MDETVNVDMSKVHVVSYPYSHEKLSSAVRDVHKDGFVKSDEYSGIYIEELSLAFITNGFHHTCVAGVEKNGIFRANRFDFEGLMRRYNSDGEYWIQVSDDEKVYRVKDFRIPVLIQFYRASN